MESEGLAELDVEVLGIDVPIGLPDSGVREADRLARRFLGAPRSSSVFPVPIRPMLNASTRLEACRLGEAVDGRRIGVQSWALMPKIRAIDTLLRRNPDLVRRVHEVHPEVSFACWRGQPMQHSKKTPQGRLERQALIDAAFGPATFAVMQASLKPDPHRVGQDDLADALAVLWTAFRLREGIAQRFPEEAAVDRAGLPMHIWA